MSMPVGMRKIYSGENVGADLTSLGYMCQSGRCAYYQDVDNIMHVYVDGVLLFSAPKQSNHLYPIRSVDIMDHPSVDSSNLLSDEQYVHPGAAMASGFPSSVVPKLASSLQLSAVDTINKDTSSYYSPLFERSSQKFLAHLENPVQAYVASISNLNREQRKRVDMAEDLVRFLHFPDTDAVGVATSMGAFSNASPLDGKDLRNLHQSRGHSPHYHAGRFHKKHMAPSMSAPATGPGHTMSFDIERNKVKSINGYTHTIRVVDEFEGYFAVIPAKSASSKDLFNAIHDYIATTYNANSHRVESAHADAESSMKSMRASFGSIGIVLTLSPPGQHAQRVERYTQTMDSRCRSTLDSLCYILPPELKMYLEVCVAAAMNYVPNSASYPFTPYEKVHGRRMVFNPEHPFLPFGAVCMVSMGEAKRATIGQNTQSHVQNVAMSEMGVCMGADPAFPASFIFYVDSTKQIVPRKVVKVLKNIIPFGWKPKLSMHQTLKHFPTDLISEMKSSNDVVQQAPLNPAEVKTSRVVDSVIGNSMKPVPVVYDPAPVAHRPAAPPELSPSPPVLSAMVPVVPPVVLPAAPPLLPPLVEPPAVVPPAVLQHAPSAASPSLGASIVPPVSVPLVAAPEPRRSTRVRNAPKVLTYDAVGSSGYVSDVTESSL